MSSFFCTLPHVGPIHAILAKFSFINLSGKIPENKTNEKEVGKKIRIMGPCVIKTDGR